MYMKQTILTMCEMLQNVPSEMLFFEDKTPLPRCSICFDFICDENKSVLSCGHALHTSCLAENIVSANNTCPLCRMELCRKVDELPTLTKTMTARLMEQILSEEPGKEYLVVYLEKIKKIIKEDEQSEKNKNTELCFHALELLMSFGFNLGACVREWIHSGPERYIEDDDNVSIHVNVDDITERMENKTNMDRESEQQTIQFLNDYELTRYIPRIMRNEYLCLYNQLMQATISVLMYPPDTSIMEPTELFTEEEAQEIYDKIVENRSE